MDSPIQSSFIPQDATKPGSAIASPRTGLGELMLLLSIVFLVASGALAGGVFLYKGYLTTLRTQKVNDLSRAKASFEPSLIDQLTRVDERMQAAQTLLGSHMAPSAFFDALEASTLSTVSFKALDMTAVDPQHITVRMQGVAQSVNSIALQAQTFSKSSVITDPIFSAISRQPEGVEFQFTGTINPVAINYAQMANGAPAAQPQDQQQQQVSAFSGPSVSNAQANTGQQAPSAPTPDSQAPVSGAATQ